MIDLLCGFLLFVVIIGILSSKILDSQSASQKILDIIQPEETSIDFNEFFEFTANEKVTGSQYQIKSAIIANN